MVPSGDLVQQFEACWSDEQWAMHLEAARHTRSAYDVAFGFLAERVRKNGSVRETEVQQRILVESGSTTYVVDKVCERGLVRRRPSGKDRRITLLSLTPAGRRLIVKIFPLHAAAMRQAVAALGPREQAGAVRLLRALGKGAAARLNG